MPYRNWAGTDTLNAVDVNAMFADPVEADVTGGPEDLSTASYTDLTTVGPAVTLTLVSGQAALVIISAFCNTVSSNAEARISYAISGGATQAADDTRAARAKFASSTIGLRLSFWDVYIASATASFTFTMKYKAASGIITGFHDRKIIVKKF